MTREAMLVSALLAIACESTARKVEDEAASPPEAVPEVLAKAVARSAVRCAQCHSEVAQTWQASAHAVAATDPLYVATKVLGEPAACEPCHVPLAAFVGAERPASEGVTCEVCHTMTDTAVDGHGGLTLDLRRNVEIGTLCDGTDNYFHRTECAELQGGSRLCAACHEWTRATVGDPRLPIVTEYSDWVSSRSAHDDLPCQACHFAGRPGELATGWRKRASVPDHSLGSPPERGRALELQVTTRRDAEHVEVTAVLRNVHAGHAVPAGLAGTSLFLELEALDASGRTLQTARFRYARELVDASGDPAPFWAATAVGSDTRLRPAEPKTEVWRVEHESAVQVLARLRWSPPIELVALGASETLVVEQRLEVGTHRVLLD